MNNLENKTIELNTLNSKFELNYNDLIDLKNIKILLTNEKEDLKQINANNLITFEKEIIEINKSIEISNKL